MSPPHTMRLAGRADWALMTAVHDALRRDLDQLLHATASHASAWTRWDTLRGQLRFHLAAEHAAMWPGVKATLTGDPHSQALLDALDDERRLLGPLQARLQTRLTSHLAHEEADALPLISQIMSPGELGQIAAAIRAGTA